jgi:hypothetical protein
VCLFVFSIFTSEEYTFHSHSYSHSYSYSYSHSRPPTLPPSLTNPTPPHPHALTPSPPTPPPPQVLYKGYLFNTSWRKVYLFATLVSFVFSILQLLLIFQWNVKIGLGGNKAFELLFAMGSFGVIQFMGAIQFLPSCRMFLAMCPEGAEGASYAMLTTLSNLAGEAALCCTDVYC